MWSLVITDPRSHACIALGAVCDHVQGRWHQGTSPRFPTLESSCRDKDRKLSPSLPPLVVFASLVPKYLGVMNPVLTPPIQHLSGSRHLRFRQSPTLRLRCLHNDRCGEITDSLALSLSKLSAGVLQTQKHPLSVRVHQRASHESPAYISSITRLQDKEASGTTHTHSQGRQEGQTAPLTTLPSTAWAGVWSCKVRKKKKAQTGPQEPLPLCLPRNLCQQRTGKQKKL